MQTRSSPSLATLHRLARYVGLPNFQAIPKALLYKRLRENYNLDRLERSEARVRRNSCSRKESLSARRIRMREAKLEQEGTPSGSSSSSSNAADVGASAASPLPTTTAGSSASHTTLTPTENDRLKTIKITLKQKLDMMNKNAVPKKKREKKVIAIDPIMLTELSSNKIWNYTRANGMVVKFGIETLIDYMIATGDFSDPETRVNFTDEELADIDETAADYGLKKASVLAAKKQPGAYDDLKFRRDALCGLERCTGEVVTSMLTTIETYDPDEAQLRLSMNEIPVFTDYLSQLKDADPAFANQCIAHWRAYLKGPPNRPHKDPYGLIDAVCRYMRLSERSGNLLMHDPYDDDSEEGSSILDDEEY